jgi:glyoxylase-like metal-dependent hydrolase (beta-lactamase superfamily II)
MSCKIGDVSITPVIEIDAPVPASFILPDAVPERLEPYGHWLRPDYVTGEGRLKLVIQALLLESKGQRIIVDTCVGNDKERSLPAWNELDGPFLERLTDAGFPREKVDLVVCTHLHVDHVGWNTMKVNGAWVPTFPNARYVMVRPELEHWEEHGEQSIGDVLGDSVRPVLDAGLAVLVESDHRINAELNLFPTPGHTPGHCSLAISSRGEEAVITGDLMHHPCQCARPDWESVADVDRAQAETTRRRFLERFADSGIPIVGTHWAGSTAVLLGREGEAWRVLGSA